MTDKDSGDTPPDHGRDDDATERVEPRDAPTEIVNGDETEPVTEPAGAAADAPTEISGSDEPTAVAPDRTPPRRPQANPLAAMRPGHVLKERFRLEEKLGAGAMGAVFRAVDQRKVETRHHNPDVAIKLLAGDFSRDSRAFIALQRETDKSQTLAHPNIITVYDFDRDGDVFFMTMESLVGKTLDAYISEGGHDRKEVLAYIEDIANAIAYAHKRNIVHSDLKPQNIFVTGEGTLKVLDFGIARAVSAMDGSGAPTDDPGEIAGLTPTYASCEMFERQEPHPADDVYAIGLIAYEMLTGEHPFGRKRADEARAEGLRPKKIKGLGRYRWQAIAKALAFERADRWQDAEAFRRKFSGAGRRVRQLSAALLAAVAAFGSYTIFYQPESGPDIPFEELPPATQQEFNTVLGEGQQARRFGDLNGALFYFDQAYELHPRNRRVMDELGKLVDNILATMEAPATPEERQRYLSQIEELRKYESLKQNPKLAARKKALEQTD